MEQQLHLLLQAELLHLVQQAQQSEHSLCSIRLLLYVSVTSEHKNSSYGFFTLTIGGNIFYCPFLPDLCS